MTAFPETTRNKEVVSHIVEEIWNQGRLDLMSTYYSPDFRNFGRALPLERFRQIIFEAWRTGFPDIHFQLEDQLAEGDQVFCHFTVSGTHLGPFVHPIQGTFPPTGKHFAVKQMHLYRFREGKVVEHSAVRDDLEMLQQLGLLPAPRQQ